MNKIFTQDDSMGKPEEEKDARGVTYFMEENVIIPREVARFNEHIYLPTPPLEQDMTQGLTKLFASMWHKAEWMGHPMRLELTRVGLLVYLANRYTTRGALKFTKLFASVWHKAEWMGRPVRLELIGVGLLV